MRNNLVRKSEGTIKRKKRRQIGGREGEREGRKGKGKKSKEE